jgi:hypothetical protein
VNLYRTNLGEAGAHTEAAFVLIELRSRSACVDFDLSVISIPHPADDAQVPRRSARKVTKADTLHPA